MNDNLEPIRRVFRNAGLYNHAADDLLCGELAAAAAPQPQAAEVLGERCIDGGKCHHACKDRCFRRECCSPFSDYTGPWEYKAAPQPQPQPQASANTSGEYEALAQSAATAARRKVALTHVDSLAIAKAVLAEAGINPPKDHAND